MFLIFSFLFHSLLLGVLTVKITKDTHLLNLPNEILLKIAEQLSPQDIYRFGRSHSLIHAPLNTNFERYLKEIYPKEVDLRKVLRVEGSSVILKANEKALIHPLGMGFLPLDVIYSFEDFRLFLKYQSMGSMYYNVEVLLDYDDLGSEDLFRHALKLLSEDNTTRVERYYNFQAMLLIFLFMFQNLLLGVIAIQIANETSLLNLPNEILLKIAEHLTPQDAYRFVRTHSLIHAPLNTNFERYLKEIYPKEVDLRKVLRVEGSSVILKANEKALIHPLGMGFLPLDVIYSFEDFRLFLKYQSMGSMYCKVEVLLDYDDLDSEDLFRHALKLLSQDNVNLASLRVTGITHEICVLVSKFVEQKKTLRHISITKSRCSCELRILESISKSQSAITHVDLSDNNIGMLMSIFAKYWNR
ncbi:hypothetical protein O9G_002354 [Rozella allomycis CSF55]|uniref:F-box domain-containing protein n=1 Tax=Rozella allomycis (strain CSF55) TaxID=988480 RepID=A0A075B548_ROZAC|nr:hypothetical protein O9G_002354 [Rozella allomycis CSF55]|eukprot:EPZ36743.1 hypothetical protein O9G_002354 [Rozella allomycis CSF55]